MNLTLFGYTALLQTDRHPGQSEKTQHFVSDVFRVSGDPLPDNCGGHTMNAKTGQDEVIGRLCGVHIRDENGEVLYSLTGIRNGEVFGRIPADETPSRKRDLWMGVGILENGTAISDEGEVLFRLV